ncbi:MAG: metallophosphoesterase family protein [Burkholderiales bacterium]
MRLGLIGDIHGNDLALEAVLAAARAADADALLVTGDLVGYYHRAAAVVALLDHWPCYIVRGNHEDMLARSRIDAAVLEHVEQKYGSGLRTALGELASAQLDRLCSLPHPLELELGSRRILLCHGAPWDNDCYVYPDAGPDILQRCAAGAHDLVVLGHTHHAMIHHIGATTIMNPGSVGQPRDRRPGAAWALYDTVTGEVSLRRESYALEPIIAQARSRDPALPYLTSVLTRT